MEQGGGGCRKGGAQEDGGSNPTKSENGQAIEARKGAPASQPWGRGGEAVAAHLREGVGGGLFKENRPHHLEVRGSTGPFFFQPELSMASKAFVRRPRCPILPKCFPPHGNGGPKVRKRNACRQED